MDKGDSADYLTLRRQERQDLLDMKEQKKDIILQCELCGFA
jgi:hypothetical protein